MKGGSMNNKFNIGDKVYYSEHRVAGGNSYSGAHEESFHVVELIIDKITFTVDSIRYNDSYWESELCETLAEAKKYLSDLMKENYEAKLKKIEKLKIE
jgi:hypothetical protein